MICSILPVFRYCSTRRRQTSHDGHLSRIHPHSSAHGGDAAVDEFICDLKSLRTVQGTDRKGHQDLTAQSARETLSDRYEVERRLQSPRRSAQRCGSLVSPLVKSRKEALAHLRQRSFRSCIWKSVAHQAQRMWPRVQDSSVRAAALGSEKAMTSVHNSIPSPLLLLNSFILTPANYRCFCTTLLPTLPHRSRIRKCLVSLSDCALQRPSSSEPMSTTIASDFQCLYQIAADSGSSLALFGTLL